MPRENIMLECTKCKRRNYMTTKNMKKAGNQRLEIKKFCKHDHEHNDEIPHAQYHEKIVY